MKLKPSKAKQADVAPAMIRSLPQVNLLPNEVVSARGISSLKRRLLGVVGLFLLLVVGAYFYAVTQVSASQGDLDSERGQTQMLMLEQAKYKEVPTILNRLSAVTTAAQLASGTEIRWKTYLDAIVAVTPPDVTINLIAVDALSPVKAAPTASDFLQPGTIGVITLTATSPERPDALKWTDAVGALYGFDDSRIRSSTHAATKEESDKKGFVTVITVGITPDALSSPFAPEVLEDAK